MRFELALAVALAATPAAAEEIAGRVTRVYDGDTLTLADRTKVRLWGIDAPERRQECEAASGRPYPCGERAQQALEALALNREVVCEVKDIDRYHRTVGRCEVDGMDLGALLVRGGLAVDYRQYSKGAYAGDEHAARWARVGMWSGRFQMPAEWRRDHR